VQQTPEHQVVKAVAAGDHVFVQLERILGHAVQARRVVLHEAVAVVIDRRIVDGGEVLRVLLERERGGGVNVDGFCEDPGKRGETGVFVLIHFGGARHEKREQVLVDLFDAQAEFAQAGASAGGYTVPGIIGQSLSANAVERLGRVAGEPVDRASHSAQECSRWPWYGARWRSRAAPWSAMRRLR